MGNITKIEIIRKATRLFIVLAIVSFPLLVSHDASAATDASFSVSPASQSVSAGSAITVTLSMNPGTNTVSNWKADLSYSTSYFSSVSVSTSNGSPFTGVPVADVASGGAISISRYSTSASAYSGSVAVITMQSTGAQGSTALTFKNACPTTASTANCSGITGGSGANFLNGLTGGSYTFTTTAASSGGATTSSSGGTTTTTKSSTKTAVKAPSGTVATTTTTPTTTTKPKQTSAPDSTATQSVTIVVLDQHKKPVANATVSVGDATAITDKDGKVTLHGLEAGNQSGTIKYKGKTQDINVQVNDGQTATHTITLQVKKASAFVPISIGLLILIVIGVVFFVGRGRLFGRFKRQPRVEFVGPQLQPVRAAVAPRPVAIKPPEPPVKKEEPKPIPEPPKPQPAPPKPVAPPVAEPHKDEIKSPKSPKLEVDHSEKPEQKPEPKPEKPDSAAHNREHAVKPGTIFRPSDRDY